MGCIMVNQLSTIWLWDQLELDFRGLPELTVGMAAGLDDVCVDQLAKPLQMLLNLSLQEARWCRPTNTWLCTWTAKVVCKHRCTAAARYQTVVAKCAVL